SSTRRNRMRLPTCASIFCCSVVLRLAIPSSISPPLGGLVAVLDAKLRLELAIAPQVNGGMINRHDVPFRDQPRYEFAKAVVVLLLARCEFLSERRKINVLDRDHKPGEALVRILARGEGEHRT